MTVIAKLNISCSPNLGLSGLKAGPDACITVTFHCIVPKLLWEWDEESHIHMRFEGDPLGSWKENVGQFVEVRYVPVFVHILCINYCMKPPNIKAANCTFWFHMYFPGSKVTCAHWTCHDSLFGGILLQRVYC